MIMYSNKEIVEWIEEKRKLESIFGTKKSKKRAMKILKLEFNQTANLLMGKELL